MAHAMASMAAGLCGSTQAVLEGSRQISGSRRLAGTGSGRVAAATGKQQPALTVIKAQQVSPAEVEVSVATRRAALGLLAAGVAGGSFAQAVLAAARPIKLGPPPAPSGGLPGTLNADEPRDLDLPLKSRFYLQPLSADKAAARAKESANDILNVKGLIAKKEWPYVMNDLRLKGSYLRYDLGTVISSKPREEKKDLTELTKSLFDKISDLDHAAKIKSVDNAQKSYAEVKSALDSVIAKLG